MIKLDLRKIPCPQNASKALIFLSTLDQGEIVEFFLDDGEPIENVPESLTLEGHQVIKREKQSDGYWKLVVKAA
jgi:sulfite reductase (ferredoxin)